MRTHVVVESSLSTLKSQRLGNIIKHAKNNSRRVELYHWVIEFKNKKKSKKGHKDKKEQKINAQSQR
ncbi:unnamed protein product [Cuscuta campestris]|uniref:Uncharacterized protein n=1 Tax=Cuscuta campestris TaxID=132261 RepID=A0A484M829_9ASTE|nr:unnamed protein product [Cuscuta campestris]